MLEVVIKGLSSLVMPISSFFVARNILEREDKISTIRVFICVILLSVLNYTIYTVKYQIIITLFNFIAVIISYKFMFKKNLTDTFIVSIVLMVLILFSETVLSIILLPLFTAEGLRSVGFSMLIANLLIGIMTILVSKIRFLKKLTKNLIKKLEKNMKIQTIILSFLSIITICIGRYITASISTNEFGFS